MSAKVLHVLTGAARSPFKRTPGADAPLVSTRLVRKGVEPDAGQLASYARICGYDRAAPVPLPYPHLLGFPLALRIMAARDFPLPLLGLVHTGIEVTQRRAPSPAERLDVTVYAAGLRAHRRGTEVEMVTEVRAAGGASAERTVPVWESRSTYLARGGRGAGGRSETGRGNGTAGAGAEAPTPAPAPTSAPATNPTHWSLTADLGRRYGRVSGDLNPLHLHPLTARLFGFRRAVAHGMWTFARCVAEAAPPEVAFVRAEFKTPVLLPAQVTYTGTPDDGGFELRGSGGELHLRGSVSRSTSRSASRSAGPDG